MLFLIIFWKLFLIELTSEFFKTSHKMEFMRES